jgi:hypothetical protein
VAQNLKKKEEKKKKKKEKRSDLSCVTACASISLSHGGVGTSVLCLKTESDE